jgi:flavin reductase (DIM6/NTAB) family NADH-FMN oxidoreductase RutF/DNA-binding MarR family transcriptional regulator
MMLKLPIALVSRGIEMKSDIDARAFRRALGNFATGVTVITSQNSQGQKVGVTANSFNSVSLDPPLVLWSLAKDSHSCNVFESASHFAINILAADQIELSNHFSRRQEEKFATVSWTAGIGDCPLLPNCAGRFQCESYERIDAGDHWIFLGKVVAFDDLGRAPLCYHQGSYSIVSTHPGTDKKDDQISAASMPRGRLSENIYFLMLRALNNYQSVYLPKQEALGTSISEARAIFLLSDNPELFADGIPELANAPQSEVFEILENLRDRGWLAQAGSGYALTEQGQLKAAQLWALADSQASIIFKDLSAEEMVHFKQTLRNVGQSD